MRGHGSHARRGCQFSQHCSQCCSCARQGNLAELPTPEPTGIAAGCLSNAGLHLAAHALMIATVIPV